MTLAKLFTGATLAVAIAAGGMTATPASAGDRDLARLLVGVAAAAIVIGATQDHRHRVTRRHVAPPRYVPVRRHHRWHHRHHWQERRADRAEAYRHWSRHHRHQYR